MTSLELLARRQPALLEADHVVTLTSPLSPPIQDISAALGAALSTPLQFPPFASAMVDGDRIALAVDASLPCLGDIVAGTVDYLLQHGAELTNLSVVLSPCSDQTLQTLRDTLPPHLFQKLAVFVHDPVDPNELGYLAASSEEALPIYVNRRLLDADVVLPITLFHSDTTLDYFGISGIFPLFADTEVMKRCSTLTSLGSISQANKRSRDAEEAAWLLGIQCIVKVVAAGQGKVLRMVAGLPLPVQAEIQETNLKSSHFTVNPLADLAIAEIDGDENEQTWANLARALFAARASIKNQGTIVLKTKLQQPPGTSLRRLTSLESPEKIEKQLSKEGASDTLMASLLVEYLQSARIFMQSNLPQEAVEDLGLGFVTDDHQIEKLLASHSRCVWIPSAQHHIANASQLA